jgi:DinB superfamily
LLVVNATLAIILRIHDKSEKMQTGNIGVEIDKTLNDFIRLLSSIDQEQINIVPFNDSWTAGQVGQHVLLSVSGFAELVNGPVKETERAPDLGVEMLKKTFLNFTTKLKSPDFIKPAAVHYIKEELVQSLEEKKIALVLASEKLDLSKTCLAFELPATGFISRLEALHFVVYHTMRHVHQLKNIRQHLIKT